MAEFPGRVRLAFKDFPLNFHTSARPAARAARCAGAGGLFWPYHDLLFVAQPAFSREDLIGYAARLGIDREAFVGCLDGGQFRDAVEADVREGLAAGVRATPTFFINGRRLVGAHPLAVFRQAVEDALSDGGIK